MQAKFTVILSAVIKHCLLILPISAYSNHMHTHTHTLGPLLPPNVTMHCIYGGKVETPQMFIYKAGQFPNTDPTTVNGDGDGTVNINSLMSCAKWKDDQVYPVTLQQFTGIEHVSMIKDPGVISYVDKIVYGTL